MEDLEGWEVVPEDGFLQIHDDGGKQIFSRKYGSRSSSSNNVFKNYFICPPPSNSSKFVETTGIQEEDHSPLSRVMSPKHIMPVPIIQLEPTTDHHQLIFKGTTEAAELTTIEKTTNPSSIKLENIKIPSMLPESDQDPVTQVFFKKMKETEFVDMKILESPTKSSRGMKPPPLPADGFHLVEEKGEVFDMKKIISSPPRSLIKVEVQAEEEDSVSVGDGGGGFNLWKWSLTGIGAICSFGVAATTVCIIIFGAHHRNTSQQQSHGLLEYHHIYADDKRMKEVVQQRATKMKEAISGPLSRGRAHITVGGYYTEAI